MFGIVFDGHPNLTRILMPDDWEGHPQRKDYPLGGVPSSTRAPRFRRRTSGGSTSDSTSGLRHRARDHRGPGLHRHRRRLGHGHRAASTRSATRRSSSTWARSTRRRTACCGWCSSSRARRSPRLRPVVGYLHTGIEKNLEYRNWTQGTTFVTRMDYLAPHVQRDRLLPRGGEAARHHRRDPERANTIRVLIMELNRISSHLVWLATTGMELGAISMMLYGFREREYILDIFEEISGLRMNHGVHPAGRRRAGPAGRRGRQDPRLPRSTCRRSSRSTRTCSPASSIWQERTQGVARARRHRLPGARHHRPGAALGRPGLGPAQDHAVLRLRDLRVRRADRDHRATSGAATWSGSPRSASR